MAVVSEPAPPPISLSSNSPSDKDDEDEDEHGTGQESSSWQNLNHEIYFMEINKMKIVVTQVLVEYFVDVVHLLHRLLQLRIVMD